MRAYMIVLLAACGGQAAPPSEAPAVPSAAPNLPPEVVHAIGSSPLYIEEISTLMLFGDERLAAQQIVADWATANGLVIIAPAKVEDLVVKASRGLDPTTNQACGPSLDRELALERWQKAAGHIKAAIYCKEDCVLQLEVSLSSKGTEFFAAPFDTGKPWRDELRDRLPTVVDNGGHEQHGHGNNPVAVKGVPRARVDLVADEDDELAFAEHAAVAAKCGLSGKAVSVLVENGRCERYADPSQITESDPQLVGCACEAIVARVKPARRAIVRIAAPAVAVDRVKTASGLYAWADLIGGNEYRTFGVAWFTPGQIYNNVAPCFAGRTTAVERQEVAATIDFDRDGRAVKATIADVNGLLQPAERDCLVTAMKQLRTPCPSEPNPTGTARISWRVSDQP